MSTDRSSRPASAAGTDHATRPPTPMVRQMIPTTGQPASEHSAARNAELSTPTRRDREPLGLHVYAIARSALLSFAALVGLACAVVFVACLALDVRPLIVASGSMEPVLPVGSMAFVKAVPASIPQPGDIVAVERPRNLGLITHRLASTRKVESGVYAYVLRGDANSSNDPEPYLVKTAGQYKFHLIWLGYLSHFVQIQTGQIIGIAIALALVAIFLLDPAYLRRPGHRRR